MSEFSRSDNVVGFIDCDVDGVKVGTSYDRKILALEFFFPSGPDGERHTIWIGMESGLLVVERDKDLREFWRGYLKD